MTDFSDFSDDEKETITFPEPHASERGGLKNLYDEQQMDIIAALNTRIADEIGTFSYPERLERLNNVLLLVGDLIEGAKTMDETVDDIREILDCD